MLHSALHDNCCLFFLFQFIHHFFFSFCRGHISVIICYCVLLVLSSRNRSSHRWTKQSHPFLRAFQWDFPSKIVHVMTEVHFKLIRLGGAALTKDSSRHEGAWVTDDSRTCWYRWSGQAEAGASPPLAHPTPIIESRIVAYGRTRNGLLERHVTILGMWQLQWPCNVTVRRGQGEFAKWSDNNSG